MVHKQKFEKENQLRFPAGATTKGKESRSPAVHIPRALHRGGRLGRAGLGQPVPHLRLPDHCRWSLRPLFRPLKSAGLSAQGHERPQLHPQAGDNQEESQWAQQGHKGQ